MYQKVIILTVFFLLSFTLVPGQCPGSDSLLKRINFLQYSSGLLSAEQIQALSPYEAGIAACTYNHDSVHTLLLQRIGTLFYSLADYSKGIYYYQRSIDLINQNAAKPSVNLKHLIPCYYWLSAFYDSLHRVTDRMKALDSCAAIAIRLRSIDKHCLWALYCRAEYSFDIGDYHRCINYANLCESLATDYARNGSKQAFNDGTQYAFSSLIWNINALILLKKYDDAEQLLEREATECRKQGLQHNLGVIYALLTEVLVLKGDFEKVLFYHNRAFAIEKRSGEPINCKAMLNSLGYEVWFKHYKNPEKALEYYRDALKYKVNVSDYRVLNALESLSILNRIANVFVLRGQYDSAFRYMQLAFDQIMPGLNETGLLNTSLDEFVAQRRIGYIATLIIDKAEAFQKKYSVTKDLSAIKEAVRIYKVADQFLERIKNEQSDVRSKLFWRSDRRRLYESAIEACYAYGNTADAFYFFERSKAVLLYDQLNQQHWLVNEDIRRQTSLKKRETQLEAELAMAATSLPRSQELLKELVNIKQDLDYLDKEIKAKNPLYYQGFLQAGQIIIADVQKKLLKNNDKLVEFFEGDSVAYSMIITTGQVLLEKMDKDSFDHTVSDFISYISDQERLNKDFNGFVNTSNRLYQLIFQQHPMPPGRIIVSPDGRSFPVEALLTNKTGTLTYLIQTHPVSYTHSARLLMIDFNTGKDAGNRNFMGMAPVQFAGRLNLASLAGSDISLQAIKSNFSNSDSRTFKEASLYNFQNEFSEYKIIQLYTHASDNTGTGDPGIYFADSVLYLSGLAIEKKPVTRLIVLSACETGTGQWYRGEGVFSFNRGFAALGIPSSVTNLWSVDNESTYRLTELFYMHLARGLPIDVSLQKAKLEFLKGPPREKSLPYYWAATIVAGKTDAIDVNRKPSWRKSALTIVLTAGLSFFAFWLFKKRGKIGKRI